MGLMEEIKAFSGMLGTVASADIYKKLIDIQIQAAQIQQENNELKKELEDLKALNDIKERLHFENNMYWVNKGNTKEGPFCSKCWDDNNKLVRLHTQDKDYRCPVCDTFIDTDPNDNNCVVGDAYSW